MVNVAPPLITQYEIRKKRTQRLHAKIIQMYNDMYHVERKRIDDVEKDVANFWEISIITLRKILSKGA